MEPFRRTFALVFLAGLIILAAFFTFHWLFIRPIWWVLVEGTLGVAIAAAGIAWSWRLSRDAGRFGGPRGGLAFGAIFAAGLVVLEVLGLARGPSADPTTFRMVMAELPVALLPVAAIALAGWRLVGSWRGAASFALAALVLVLYLGGAIMHEGGTGRVLGLFAILAPSYLLAGAALGRSPRMRARTAASERRRAQEATNATSSTSNAPDDAMGA